jgi:hypothetical protein
MFEGSDLPKNQESPLKQEFDKFDVEHIRWGIDDYKEYALQVPAQYTTNLTLTDWQWRAEHGRNVIASAFGETGSGKSSFISYACLYCGNIFRQPFTTDNVYYEPEELKEAISKAKPRETFLRDEHLHGEAGMMSDLVSSTLTDFEQQLRRKQNNFFFASVNLEDHAHFFVFELKHILYDATGYPTHIMAMLKTPRYTDTNCFVWRGLVAFPFPEKKYWEAYTKRKDNHIERLVKQYGNNIAPVNIDAVKIFKKRHEELYTKTREGLVRPIKDNLMQFIVAEEIGSRKYTNKAYDMLRDKIRERINFEFAEQNEARMQEIAEQKEQDKAEKKEMFLLQIEEAKKIKEAKLEIQKQFMEENKRKNDLKQKALELKEVELKKANEFKEIKAKHTEQKIANKKEELTKKGDPKRFFAEQEVG